MFGSFNFITQIISLLISSLVCVNMVYYAFNIWFDAVWSMSCDDVLSTEIFDGWTAWMDWSLILRIQVSEFLLQFIVVLCRFWILMTILELDCFVDLMMGQDKRSRFNNGSGPFSWIFLSSVISSSSEEQVLLNSGYYCMLCAYNSIVVYDTFKVTLKGWLNGYFHLSFWGHWFYWFRSYSGGCQGPSPDTEYLPFYRWQ